jgi:hypothetical protein
MIAKDSQIVEVLEDGTIYAFDLEVCDREADKVLRNLAKKEGKLFNFDFSATVFTLFVHCVHILRNSGWQTDDLIDEVLEHTAQYDEQDEDRDDE